MINGIGTNLVELQGFLSVLLVTGIETNKACVLLSHIKTTYNWPLLLQNQRCSHLLFRIYTWKLDTCIQRMTLRRT